MVENLNQLVASGNLKGAITELQSILKSSPKLDEIIIQSARYNNLKKDIRLGIIDFESANISKNKITLAVLELISEIDDAKENHPEVEIELNKYKPTITINQNHSGSGHNFGGDQNNY